MVKSKYEIWNADNLDDQVRNNRENFRHYTIEVINKQIMRSWVDGKKENIPVYIKDVFLDLGSGVPYSFIFDVLLDFSENGWDIEWPEEEAFVCYLTPKVKED